MKKYIFFFAMVLLAACNVETDPFQEGEAVLHFKASSPSDQETRVALKPKNSTLDYMMLWEEGDVVYAKSSYNGCQEANEIHDISDDKTQASFDIYLKPLDSSSNPTVTMPTDLLLYSGVNGYIIANEPCFDVPVERTPLQRFKAKVWRYLRSVTKDNASEIRFSGLGTYELLHVKNTTSQNITFCHDGFEAESYWYYQGGTYYPEDIERSYLQEVAACESNSMSLTIRPNESATVVSWYIPTGKKIKNARLVAKINGKSTVSANIKTSDATIEQGQAYHMYAIWNGKELKFGKDDEQEEEQDPPTTIPVTSISVKGANPMLKPGETLQLRAEVKPENATNKAVTWTSNDTSVATVSANGLVSAIGSGTATITATATDGSGVSGWFAVSVSPADDLPESGEADGHEYVNLGLPSGTLWATCNIGANVPEEFGNYYAWGETAKKEYYSWSTYKWCNGTINTITKYCTKADYGNVDDRTALEMADDVSQTAFGPSWHIPSAAQWNELINNCTWTKLDNGYLVRGRGEKTIFLPMAGYMDGNVCYDKNSTGYYWSADLDRISPDDAWFIIFGNGTQPDLGGYYRSMGRSIRPVTNQSGRSAANNMNK